MFNIMQRSGRHNPRSGDRIGPDVRTRRPARRALAALIAVLTLIGMVGSDIAVSRAGDCPIAIDSTGWSAFQKIAEKLADNQDVSRGEYAFLCEQPSYALLLRSMKTKEFNPHILSRVMQHVFADTNTANYKMHKDPRGAPKRRDLVESFEYVRDHTGEVNALIERFESPEIKCRIYELAKGYVRGEHWPDPLTISFLAAVPEIRYWENHLLVDVGLAIASDTDQLCRILASVLYRDLEAPQRPLPYDEESGAEALSSAYEHLAYNGIAAWMEDYPAVVFREDHPLLGNPQTWRRDNVNGTAVAFETMNKYLTLMMKDPEALQEYGTLIDDVVRGASNYDNMGYVMAALIVARFGEDRLRNCANSPADFLRAYQEAASIPQVLTPAGPWADFARTLEDLPALPATEYELLLTLMTTGSIWQ